MEIVISKIERKLAGKHWECITMLTSQLAVLEEKVLEKENVHFIMLNSLREFFYIVFVDYLAKFY
ncbi:hypothetical protein HF849_22000 [Clostridium beijerinckii]|uniref:Uncharacterized protein n=1 Tax=Clostridium beijerinckii TaxID=1520 RepID=A0A7X9XR84_CLOBE|nr:hypothetical protein [Clostridium beijerinckii]